MVTQHSDGNCSFSFWIQVALGSVTNVEEAVRWLSYTYLYVRMRANPLVYGISHKVFQVGVQSAMSFNFDLIVTYRRVWAFIKLNLQSMAKVAPLQYVSEYNW